MLKRDIVVQLDEEILSKVRELKNYEDGSDRKMDLLKEIEELCKIRNDYLKSHDEKGKRYVDLIKVGVDIGAKIGLFAAALALRNRNFKEVLLFEETGTIASIAGREITRDILQMPKL